MDKACVRGTGATRGPSERVCGRILEINVGVSGSGLVTRGVCHLDVAGGRVFLAVLGVIDEVVHFNDFLTGRAVGQPAFGREHDGSTGCSREQGCARPGLA